MLDMTPKYYPESLLNDPASIALSVIEQQADEAFRSQQGNVDVLFMLDELDRIRDRAGRWFKERADGLHMTQDEQDAAEEGF